MITSVKIHGNRADIDSSYYIDLINTYKRLAENMFGLRNNDVNITRLQLGYFNFPCVYFEFGSPIECHINLAPASIIDLNELKYELAHEVIHTLKPCNKDDCTVLEEGLATYFQLKVADYNNQYVKSISDARNYQEAYDLVQPILDRTSNFVQLISNNINKFNEIKKEDLKKADEKISDEVAKKILAKFVY